MALVPSFDYSTYDIRALLQPLRNDISIALYNCQNAFAVGAIIRVAHSFLVREILIVGQEPYYEKASMGMQHFENISVFKDEDEFFHYVHDRPVWAIEKDAAKQSLYEVMEYPKNVIFMVGSERFGLPLSVLERSQNILGIPMYGINHSFPVTVATGIVLNDWARRRYQSGTWVVPQK